MGLLAPNPRKFFEKNLTKNFQAWVQCEHRRFNRRAHYVRNKKDLSAKFFERGAGKSFLLRKFSPHSNINYHL